ncbi:hypothetical protein [Nocardioides alcanivorans]|nr:hypothetical protein [Nocardioides alcanivorans]
MKLLFALLSVVAVGAGLRYASNRISMHQPVLPAINNRINTQVHRINQ